MVVFDGKVWRDGRYWLIEVPALDLMTQGKSRNDALVMLKDAIRLLIDKKGMRMTARLVFEGHVSVTSHHDSYLIALMLRRQRTKHGLSLADVARILGFSSINAYAQYEQGKNLPSLTKIQEFLTAMDRQMYLTLNITNRKKAA